VAKCLLLFLPATARLICADACLLCCCCCCLLSGNFGVVSVVRSRDDGKSYVLKGQSCSTAESLETTLVASV